MRHRVPGVPYGLGEVRNSDDGAVRELLAHRKLDPKCHIDEHRWQCNVLVDDHTLP
jgi:hypothetical protein